MKWIGQHIYDLASRFRSDVFLEDISTGTIASGAHLGLDSNNKIVKAAVQSLRVKLIPSSFTSDDSGRPTMIDDTGEASENFFVESSGSSPVYAFVDIPTGHKATHIMVHGSATDAIECWEMQINSKTGVSKGTGNVDTEINITDVTSSTTNYLLIQVANASGNEIHGGYITIAVA